MTKLQFLHRIYCVFTQFCEREGWKFELMTNKVSEPAGTKAVMKIDGDDYKYLKFESGVHRVQRVQSRNRRVGFALQR